MLDQAVAYVKLLDSQWPFWWWFPILIGGGMMFWRHPRRAVIGLAGIISTGLAVFWILNMWTGEHALSLLEEFVVPSYLLLAVPLGIGLMELNRFVRVRFVLPVAVCAAVAGQAWAHWGVLSRNKGLFPAEYGLRLLEGAPPRSHLFCSGDTATFMLMYWHQVEGRRPDMTLYDDTGVVLTDLYGPDFYVTPEPRHTQWLEHRQRELIRTTDRPVCFILGSYLHNLPDVSFHPDGLIYQVQKSEVRSQKSEVWKRYGWHEWSPPLSKTVYLERDILAQIPLARAESWFERGNMALAKKEYREASRLGAGIDAVQTSLVAILVKKQLFDLGVEVAEEAVARFPHDPDSYNSAGAAYLSLRQFDLALKHFREAIRLRLDMTNARHNLILTYVEMKQWADVERETKQALNISPADPTMYRHLAAALVEQQRLGEVVPLLEGAVQRSPQTVDLIFQLGNVQLKLGQPAQAAGSFERALRLKPDFSVAANNWGVALGHLGRYEEALRAYQIAVQLDPTYAEACANLAGAYYNLHRYEEAKHWWRRTLKLNPGHAVARQFLEKMR